MKNTPLEDVVFVILLVLAAIMGFFAGKLQGSQEIRAQALYLKHAQNVVIWDGTNAPVMQFQWITNK